MSTVGYSPQTKKIHRRYPKASSQTDLGICLYIEVNMGKKLGEPRIKEERIMGRVGIMGGKQGSKHAALK